MSNKIYTHDEATILAELCEIPLLDANICVPSPEDDDREEDDMLGLYGTPYDDLLTGIESHLVSALNQKKIGKTVNVSAVVKDIIKTFEDVLKEAKVEASYPNLELELTAAVTALLAKCDAGTKIVEDTYSGTI